MPDLSAPERRAKLLADRLSSRANALVSRLTTGTPPWQVPVSEEDQVRVYRQRLAVDELAGDAIVPGGLKSLRRSNGGPHSDEQVDRYAAKMEPLLAKYDPERLLNQYRSILERQHGAFTDAPKGVE